MPDYSQLLYDPFAPGTLAKLEQYEEFKFEAPDKPRLISYLIIMYDINSDMKRLYPDNLWERKRNSAIAVGFRITDGHFEGWVESYLVGENDQFNEAVLRFIRLFGIPDLPALMAYTEILHKQVLAAMKETNEKKLETIQKNIENAIEKISLYERKVYGGEETEQARKSLYLLIEKQRLSLRPEDKAKEIETKTLRVTDPYYGPKRRPGRPRKYPNV